MSLVQLGRPCHRTGVFCAQGPVEIYIIGAPISPAIFSAVTVSCAQCGVLVRGAQTDRLQTPVHGGHATQSGYMRVDRVPAARGERLSEPRAPEVGCQLAEKQRSGEPLRKRTPSRTPQCPCAAVLVHLRLRPSQRELRCGLYRKAALSAAAALRAAPKKYFQTSEPTTHDSASDPQSRPTYHINLVLALPPRNTEFTVGAAVSSPSALPSASRTRASTEPHNTSFVAKRAQTPVIPERAAPVHTFGAGAQRQRVREGVDAGVAGRYADVCWSTKPLLRSEAQIFTKSGFPGLVSFPSLPLPLSSVVCCFAHGPPYERVGQRWYDLGYQQCALVHLVLVVPSPRWTRRASLLGQAFMHEHGAPCTGRSGECVAACWSARPMGGISGEDERDSQTCRQSTSSALSPSSSRCPAVRWSFSHSHRGPARCLDLPLSLGARELHVSPCDASRSTFRHRSSGLVHPVLFFPTAGPACTCASVLSSSLRAETEAETKRDLKNDQARLAPSSSRRPAVGRCPPTVRRVRDRGAHASANFRRDGCTSPPCCLCGGAYRRGIPGDVSATHGISSMGKDIVQLEMLGAWWRATPMGDKRGKYSLKGSATPSSIRRSPCRPSLPLSLARHLSSSELSATLQTNAPSSTSSTPATRPARRMRALRCSDDRAATLRVFAARGSMSLHPRRGRQALPGSLCHFSPRASVAGLLASHLPSISRGTRRVRAAWLTQFSSLLEGPVVLEDSRIVVSAHYADAASHVHSSTSPVPIFV
ncbi:hypothetical protein DFH06DRAFT_1488825 [Mycena polygramma]|nr:hypothetical protein DFH06DRAFT_1488825 [Mycena polygramma]